MRDDEKDGAILKLWAPGVKLPGLIAKPERGCYDARASTEKMRIKRSVDPCKEKGVPNHYHETNSASSALAPASACVTAALLTGTVPSDVACRDVAKHSDFALRLQQRGRQ